MTQRSGAPARPRRAELIAALSLAIDLGLGLPLEHMLRSCWIAMRLADLVGADAVDRETAYYGGLLAWIGCHADSEEFSELFGDDVAFRAASYSLDWRGPRFAAFLMRRVGTERPGPERLARLARFATHARAELGAVIGSHCVSAGALAGRLGLPSHVVAGLRFTFERWDGSGLPAGASREGIPLGMRLVHIADVAEVHLARGGLDAAVRAVRERSGTQFDPELVEVFCANADVLQPPEHDAWGTVLDLAPDRDERLTEAQTDELLAVMGDFVDLKCPWTVGHSRAVAQLAAGAGRILGLDAAEVDALQRAGHVLDIGRMGVPNRVWRTAAPRLAEQERIRLHPYLTRRILDRVDALRSIAALAGAHHERVDGAGYPQGLAGAELSQPARILAAADAYRRLREADPLDGALDREGAAARLRADARAGALDVRSVEAVLEAAGIAGARRVEWPGGLTDREAAVLRLIAAGASANAVAAQLSIAPKTARNHIEHIYTKIGASNRTEAALFAVQHGLIGLPPDS
jgi:HD-GYP domain-containing protein (c-di-GMP phosphodiesterase class II)